MTRSELARLLDHSVTRMGCGTPVSPPRRIREFPYSTGHGAKPFRDSFEDGRIHKTSGGTACVRATQP